MLIDLTDVLSQDGNTQEESVALDMTHFKRSRGEFYKLLDKSPVQVTIHHEKDQVITITGRCRVSLQMNCARCLKPVRKDLELSFAHRVDILRPGEDEDELEMSLCIKEGKLLDVDQLVHNEILINLPIRVLCKEDCKGICPICGQDLNEGACSCDQGPADPRMAAFQEIFSKFKEV